MTQKAMMKTGVASTLMTLNSMYRSPLLTWTSWTPWTWTTRRASRVLMTRRREGKDSEGDHALQDALPLVVEQAL